MRTGLFGALLMVAGLASAGEGGWVDAHLHYVDFMQQSDGSEAMLAAMDEAGVEDAWLFGLPVVKKWQQDAPRRPRYYLGDEAPLYYYSATDDIVAGAVRDLPEDQRRRLAPFISGFNPTDMNAARHVQALIERYPGLWRGIGEVITRHDDLTALTAGETAREAHSAIEHRQRVVDLNIAGALAHDVGADRTLVGAPLPFLRERSRSSDHRRHRAGGHQIHHFPSPLSHLKLPSSRSFARLICHRPLLSSAVRGYGGDYRLF